jgi:hypothetical protein
MEGQMIWDSTYFYSIAIHLILILRIQMSTQTSFTYLGSGICSYSLTKDGAIFMVMVPAVIIRSACLGLDLGTKP